MPIRRPPHAAPPTVTPASPATPSPAAGVRREEDDNYPSPRYAWYVVGVLTVACAFSFIDRQVLALLVDPIRRDLGINDTAMSLLMGLAFALFYTAFGIPLGRLADARSRRTLIAVGMVTWSLMTAACGLARTFWHLLLARIGVGIGEAALSPAAFSLIADTFPEGRRATAISVYSMGIYVGAGLASVLGGLVVSIASAVGGPVALPLVGPTRPWQLVFFVVGLTGALMALLLFTVREPTRKGARVRAPADGAPGIVPLPLRDVLAYLRANRGTFLCHNLGFALLSFSAYGSASWVPTLFIRTYGWTATRAGVVFGVIVMVFGGLGITTGGRLADALAARGRRDAAMRVGLLATLAWLPTGTLFPLMPTPALAAALLAPTVFFGSMPFGVAAAAIQQMTPNAMRGQASALYLFVINLVGLGLGPTAVALTTDYVFRDDGALRYSLLLVATLAHVAAAALLWLGLNRFVRSLDYLGDWVRTRA
jgi:MFS family permease